MTFAPDQKVEVRCPLGFTVQLKRQESHECGHQTCHPESCERLRRMGHEIPCPNWEQVE